MTKHLLSVDPASPDYSVLLCPHCGENYVHLNEVYIAGRPREDGDIFPVKVDSHGLVTEGLSVVVPFGTNGAGRRHTISLVGWCESCSQRIAIAFQQHKGETHVSTLTQTWTPTGD